MSTYSRYNHLHLSSIPPQAWLMLSPLFRALCSSYAIIQVFVPAISNYPLRLSFYPCTLEMYTTMLWLHIWNSCPNDRSTYSFVTVRCPMFKSHNFEINTVCCTSALTALLLPKLPQALLLINAKASYSYPCQVCLLFSVADVMTFAVLSFMQHHVKLSITHSIVCQCCLALSIICRSLRVE